MGSTGRLRFAQIDGLKANTQEDANEGDILVFDKANEEFKAEAPGSLDFDRIIGALDCTVVFNNQCNVVTKC